MTDLTVLTRNMVLGKQETLAAQTVRDLVTYINNSDVIKRWILLHLFEAKAHIVVHCDSFEEFCDKDLKMGYNSDYYSRLVRAARVERALFGTQTVETLSAKEFPKTSLKALLLLAAIPEDELKEAWEEYRDNTDAKQSGAVTPGHAITALRNIVARNAANKPASPVTPEQPPVSEPPAHVKLKEVNPFAEEAIAEPAEAVQQTQTVEKEPAAVETAPKKTSSSPVSSFTPKPDAPAFEDDELPEIDWEEAEWQAELNLSCVKQRKIALPAPTRRSIAKMLRRLACWYEEEL